MNSAVRRFSLFFFSLALFASCEDPSDIGLDLQDENQIGAFYTDTFTVNTGTVLHPDSILSFKQYPLPLGGYQDATLGNVKATVFTEIGLSGLDVKFGDNLVADSLVLTLDYTTDIYGADNIASLMLNVHRLTEGFQNKASYFTNSSLAYDNNVLGSASFDPDKLDSTSNGNTIFYTKAVRIKLDMALANELIAQSGKDPLKDQFKFVQFLKGFAIVPTRDAPRELLSLNLSSTSKTKLTLYYKNGTEKKEYNFLLSGSNVRNFAKIESNRGGTALAGLQKYTELPSSQTGGESYIQAGTQLFTKITIPYLNKLKEKYGNIVINRAELIVPVKTNSFATLMEQSELAIYETNSSNRILYTFQGTPKTVPIDNAGAINSYNFPTSLRFYAETREEDDVEVRTGEGRYKANITAYVQAILRGDRPDMNNGLLISPARFLTGSNGSSTISNESIPKRAIISNTPENGVKLRIYFSKLD